MSQRGQVVVAVVLALGLAQRLETLPLDVAGADQDGLELARGFVQPSDGAKVKGRSAEAAAQ